ncbi:MAG TPA: carbohydrate kinase family protein [Sedimentisphaerales bacterium]|nr:carbohydrate kinase family protein [Sedimentisphaerales bacterium]
MDASPNPKKVLCVGDLVADIAASPVARLPEPGELVLTDRIAVFPGGNALNTAVALRRLGEQVVVAGSVGDDALGRLLLGQMQTQGLDVCGVRREPGGRTASTFILRAEGQDRRFIHSLGVAATFRGEHVSPDLIPDNGVMLVGGYLKLGAWDDNVLADLMRRARQRNCRVVLNVCIAQDSGVDPRRCLRLLEHVDVFVPNEDEARILTGETVPARQAQVLRRAGVRIAVITRGRQGLYADDGQRKVEMGIFHVPLVDPSGCGDCFTAGLIAGLLRGWDTTRVLELASAVGALGATALGCTDGVPSFEAVERFLKENKVTITVKPGDGL